MHIAAALSTFALSHRCKLTIAVHLLQFVLLPRVSKPPVVSVLEDVMNRLLVSIGLAVARRRGAVVIIAVGVRAE